DRHDPARLRVVGPIDPAEAAGGDLVEDAVAAEEVAVVVPLEELLALEGGQVALALQDAKERSGVAAALTELGPGLLDLFRAKQTKTDRAVGKGNSIRRVHVGNDLQRDGACSADRHPVLY